MDKWMNIIDMGYVIASRYNVILISLSFQQSMIVFPLRSEPKRLFYTSCNMYWSCVWYHVYGNHFVLVKALSFCLCILCIK